MSIRSIFSFFVFTIIASFIFVFNIPKAQATLTYNGAITNDLFGSAYSDNIGSVSFNNCASTDPSSCVGSIRYKVYTSWSSGNPDWTYLAGYAWSDSIGWIVFATGSGCPATPVIPNWTDCHMAYNTNTGAMYGWARALSYGDGWDGWINFNGVTVGTQNSSGLSALSGNAWGSDVVGALNMAGVGVGGIPPVSSVSLVANPTNVAIYDGNNISMNQTTLVWSGQNVTSCTATSSPYRSDWTGTLSSTNGSGSKTVQVGTGTSSVTYNVSCTNTVTNQTVQASTTVTIGGTPGSDLGITLGSIGPVVSISQANIASSTLSGNIRSTSGVSGSVTLSVDKTTGAYGSTNPTEILNGGYDLKVYECANHNTLVSQPLTMGANSCYYFELITTLSNLPATGNYNLYMVASSNGNPPRIVSPSYLNGFNIYVSNNTPTLTFASSSGTGPRNTVTPASLPYTGGTVNLTWNSTNTTDCTASSNWDSWAGSPSSIVAGGGKSTTQGVASGTVTSTETFTVTCNATNSTPDQKNTITLSVTVIVPLDPAMPTVSLIASQTKYTGTIAHPTLSWTSKSATSCGNPVPSGWTSKTSTSGSQSVTLTSSTTYSITCFNAKGSAMDTVTVTLNGANPGPDITMSATPTRLPAGGGSVVINWTSTNSVVCHAVNPANWTTKTSTSGSEIVTLGAKSGSYDFILSCSNSSNISATASISVSVPEPVQLKASLYASPVVNSKTTLTWSSSGATSCTAPWTKSKAVSGRQADVPVTGNTSFSIVCWNGDKSVVATVDVTDPIIGEITVTLNAVPPALAVGGEVTLVWNTTVNSGSGIVSCRQEIGSRGTDWSKWTGATGLGYGNARGIVSESETFSITCTNGAKPSSASADVIVDVHLVDPLTVSLFASPSILHSVPSDVDLSWNSTGAASCTLSWNSSNSSLSGTETVTVSNETTFSIVCGDGNGSFASSSAKVQVDIDPSNILDTSIDANPIVLYDEGRTQISWSSSGAAVSCIKDWMNPSDRSTSGSSIVNLSSSKKFTVTCSDAGANEESASVEVIVKSPYKLRVSISATPSSSFGSRSLPGSGAGSVTVDWSSVGATDCTPSWLSTKNGDVNGSESIWVANTTTFVVDCTDGNQSASASVLVSLIDTDNPLIGSAIFANPPSLPSAGGIVKLLWDSIGLRDCRPDSVVGSTDWSSWGGGTSTSGSASKRISLSDIFGITCLGPGMSSISTTGVVVSPSSSFDLHVSLSSDTIVLDSAGKVLISWDSNADSCAPSWSSSKNGKKDSDSVDITGTETFTVVCSTGKAEASSTITVFVLDPNGYYINLSVNPISRFSKGPAVITWSSNAQSCDKKWMNNPGDVATDGSDAVNITETTTFTVVCADKKRNNLPSRSVTVRLVGDGEECKGYCPGPSDPKIHKQKYKER